MKVILASVAAAGIGGGAYSMGAFDQGEYYDLTPQAASRKLEQMQFPPEFSGSMGAIGAVSVDAREAVPDKVRWEVTYMDAHIADLTANLNPSGDGVKVSVDFEVADTDGAEELRAALPIDNAMIGDVVELAVTEKIDATLDGRSYDDDKVAAAMAKYVISNPGKVADYSRDMIQAIENANNDTVSSDFVDDMASDWGD